MTASVTQQYRLLLSEMAPCAIHSEAENERAIAHLEKLTSKVRVTQAEQQLIELLSILIGDFEEKHYAPKRRTKPSAVLQELMAANELRQKDLVDVFGSPSIVSEVLHGKRNLTVDHIRKLSRRFRVSPAVFIA